MTWVFGSPTWLGSSVSVADIQVTVGDETFDCLRKLYGLHQNVMAGFAGSVLAGFAMLARLQQLIDETPSEHGAVDLDTLFDRFPAVAQEVFDRLPDAALDAGSEVLVAGAESAGKTLYGSRPRAVRFMGPDFTAEPIPHQEWASIGCGSQITAYQAELEKVTGEEGRGLVQMEVGRPGGHAQMMARFVTMQVGNLPSVPGISKHFHVGVVFADGWEITTSDRDFFPPDGPPQEIRMPPVATSWAELEALLDDRASGDLARAIA
jgi:hypothetical protein